MGRLKMNKKFISIAFITVALLAIVIFIFFPSNISRDEATQIAIEHVGGGNFNIPSRDFENFQRVWSVEVFYENLVHEVYVSMRSGEIVRVEISSWD